MPIKNLVGLARSVLELWLLLYTVYKNTGTAKQQFLYADYVLRNISVYVLRYTLSLNTAERSACTAVFGEESLVKTKKESPTKKVSKIYALFKRVDRPERVSSLAARKYFRLFSVLRARALARRDRHG